MKSIYRIQYYITKSGIKHTALAEALELKKSCFSKRYHGHYRWQLDELKRLAPIIGCSLSDLIGEE